MGSQLREMQLSHPYIGCETTTRSAREDSTLVLVAGAPPEDALVGLSRRAGVRNAHDTCRRSSWYPSQ
jgi:hypothetical protein